MKIDVMGVRFDNVTMAEALEKAEQMLQSGQTHYVVTPNSEIVYEAMASKELEDLLNEASLVLPDGAGVVLGAKILGTPLKEKVAGGVYLLGSKPGVAELAAEKMLLKHPGLTIAGLADGYFKDDGPVIEKINEAKADALFVCLGAPKQERFMKAHLEELDVRLMAGLGGSLDRPWRQPGQLRRNGEAGSPVDDQLLLGVVLPAPQRAVAVQADASPAQVPLGRGM